MYEETPDEKALLDDIAALIMELAQHIAMDDCDDWEEAATETIKRMERRYHIGEPVLPPEQH